MMAFHYAICCYGWACAVLLLLSGQAQGRLGSAAALRKLHTAPRDLVINQQYIVVLNDSVTDVGSMANLLLQGTSATTTKIGFVYEHSIKGFSVSGLAQVILYKILLHDQVKYVKEDSIVTKYGDQLSAPWGLDRIDQASLPLNSIYHYDYTGAGVSVYVVDTGILTTHVEFQTNGVSRAVCGKNFIAGETCTDLDGHGTHVAGSVGGNTYGVAKGVSLYAVKVLDKNGSGSDSGVVAGIDFVTSQKKANPSKPTVANMSLGGSFSKPINDSTIAAVAAGVVFAVAAGNDNLDACVDNSPASVAVALTVGATTKTDTRASFSDFGTCLDLFAPGEDILSCGITSNTAKATMSGTSMASPHVAGAAALFLEKYPGSTPDQIRTYMLAAAVNGKVTSIGTGSPNILLQSPLLSSAPPPTAPVSPPTAPVSPPTAPVAPPTFPVSSAWINEFHYDNAGTDAGEFVEVMSTSSTDLTGWKVVLYNGGDGASYATYTLTAGTVVGSVRIVSVDTTGIQNGAPDGLALVDPSGFVVEFLSYEGTFTAASGPASGKTSTNIGASEDGTSNAVGTSLQRTGTGCSAASFGSWTGPITATRGSVNTGQTISCTVSPPTAPVTPPTAPVTPPTAPVAPPTAPVTPPTAPVAPPTAPVSSAWINEFHYDNAGTDVGEFVEVMATSDIDLTNGWKVVLYNGSGGKSYATFTFSSATKVSGVYVASVNTLDIQNGAPDGLALVNPSGMVEEFLSYEGVFTATDGPAAGTTSTNVVVSEDGNTNAVGTSLQRTGTGCSRGSFKTWAGPITATRGAVNTGQVLSCSLSVPDSPTPAPVSAPIPISAAPCPTRDICSGGYFVHRTVLSFFCMRTCIPINEVPFYLSSGYQCGKCF